MDRYLRYKKIKKPPSSNLVPQHRHTGTQTTHTYIYKMREMGVALVPFGGLGPGVVRQHITVSGKVKAKWPSPSARKQGPRPLGAQRSLHKHTPRGQQAQPAASNNRD